MLSREKAPTSPLRLQLGSVRLMEINHHHPTRTSFFDGSWALRDAKVFVLIPR